MGNYLKVYKRQQVVALLELGWSYRRIESETGVRRETVSRYDKQRGSNPAKAFPGSEVVSGCGLNDLGDSESANPAKVTLSLINIRVRLKSETYAPSSSQSQGELPLEISERKRQTPPLM